MDSECKSPGSLRLVSVASLLTPDPAIVIDEWINLELKENPVLTTFRLEYAAISHVWKATSIVERLSSSETKFRIDLGDSKEDYETSWLGLFQAAKAAKHLKCDYLWLDLLCVHQYNDDDKRSQIDKMPAIYKNAKAVLVMFGGCAAAQGIDDDSSWIRRAWTLQESTINKNTYGLINTNNFDNPKYKDTYEIEHGGNIEILGNKTAYIELRTILELVKKPYLGNIIRGSHVHEVKLPINCLGNDTRAIETLRIVFDSINGIHGNRPEEKAIVKSAAWSSIWIRESTKPRDMVYSMMHLLGVKLEVDYEPPAMDDLYRELVHQSCEIKTPVWLTIAPNANVSEGLIPRLPEFPSNSPGYYDNRLASSYLANIDSMIDRWDIVVHSDNGKRFTLCGKIMHVSEISMTLPAVKGEPKIIHASFSTQKGAIKNECIVFKETADIAMVVGRQWKKSASSTSFCDICIIFLDKEDEWRKVGQGNMTINGEGIKILSGAERRHISILTSDELEPCHCLAMSESQFLDSWTDIPEMTKNDNLNSTRSFSPSSEEISGYILATDDHNIQECQNAIKMNPINYWLWHDLSRLYAAKNDVNGAIQACLLGIEKWTTNPSPLMELSNLYAANGDHKSAILTSTKLSKFKPRLLQLALNGSGMPSRLNYDTELKRSLQPLRSQLHLNSSVLKMWLSSHNAACASSINSSTNIHLAAWTGNQEVMERSVIQGYDNTLADGDGFTTLHLAVWNMHTEMTNFLLGITSQRNWVSKQNKDGQSALHFAAWNGDVKMVEILINTGAEISLQDNDELTPLYWAAKNRHVHSIKVLMEADKGVSRPIHLAAAKGHTDVIRPLKEAGFDVSELDENGKTPMHLAAINGHIDVIKALRDMGAGVSAKDKDGLSPMHFAAGDGHVNAINALREMGAIVSAKDKSGWTPMHCAARNGHVDAIKALRNMGADVLATADNGWTPMHNAAWNGQVDAIKTLREMGAIVSAKDKAGRMPMYYAALAKHVDAINALK